MSSARVTNLDQRSYIKIETLRGRTPTEIYDLLREVCGANTMNRSTISRWSAKFKRGQTSVEDDPRSGRPRTSLEATNASIVATIIDEDRRLTLEEIAQEANLSKTSVQRIMKEMLQKRKICARWVPHCLNEEQRARRVEVATQLLNRYEAEGEGFLKRIVAIDETWIRDFEPELKSQSMAWKGKGSPRVAKFRRQQTKLKQMVIMAYDWEGVLVCDRVEINTNVDGNRYAYFIRKRLRPQIRKTRRTLLEAGVIILHDNARPHLHASVKSAFDEYGWETLPHPAYSPDMSPPDFDLFQKLKEPLRGVRFHDLTALNDAVSRRIRELNSKNLLNGIERLPERWRRVIESQGDYIERL